MQQKQNIQHNQATTTEITTSTPNKQPEGRRSLMTDRMSIESSIKLQDQGIYGHQMDMIGAQSLRTISRGSLELVPDLGEKFQGINYDEQFQIPNKYSNNSIFEQVEEELVEYENQLIEQTLKLALSDQHSQCDKNNFDAIKSQGQNSLSVPEQATQGKRQKVKKAKHLVRELKKYLRGDTQPDIKGNFKFKFQGSELTVKRCPIYVNINEVGGIEGITIENGVDDIELRVIRDADPKIKYKVDMWTGMDYIQVKFIAEIYLE